MDEEIFHRCKHALRNTNRESYITRKISRLTPHWRAPRGGDTPSGPDGGVRP